MPQDANQVKDHFSLFREPEYKELIANKRAKFEGRHDVAEVERVREWAKTEEYKELNFKREALTVNPAKACQPLGAVFVAVGFEGTIPFVHGSQGCVAYYRSHFSRHFKEPTSCVSSSMTEDAAVFGGLNNMIDGLANTYAMYKPKMIAVSTTCMAEVIGDDLNAFIKTAREKGSIPAEYPVPFAHTPAFVGSHITGYDNAMKGVLEYFWDGRAGTIDKVVRKPNGKINFLGGFDGYTVGNTREIKRIFDLMKVEYTILGDNSDVWDTPTDGEFRMYDGGTTLEDAEAAVHAKATISMQEYCTEKTLPMIAAHGQETVAFTLSRGERIDGDDFACRHDECLSATLWKTAVSAPFPIVQSRPREESGTGLAEPAPAPRPAAPPEAEDGQLDNIKVSRAELLDALEATGWVQAKAARRLGLTPRQIGYALRRYGIELKRL